MDVYKAPTQAQIALDSFKLLQAALPLPAGCVRVRLKKWELKQHSFGGRICLSPAIGKVNAVSGLCLPSSLDFQTVRSCLRSSDIPCVLCH